MSSSTTTSNKFTLFGIHIPSVLIGIIGSLSAIKLYNYRSKRNYFNEIPIPTHPTLKQLKNQLTQLRDSIHNNSKDDENSSLLDFFLILGRLKLEKRTGWVLRNVYNPESIADHQYRMAMISLSIQNDEKQKIHCMKMSLVHDLAESLVGDITPEDSSGINVDDKHKLELEAIETIGELVAQYNLNLSKEISNLYNEYSEQKTEAAKFVKQLDKLDMILQAYEYELLNQEYKNNPSEFNPANRIQQCSLSEFYSCTENLTKNFSHPQIAIIVKQLMKRRENTIKPANL